MNETSNNEERIEAKSICGAGARTGLIVLAVLVSLLGVGAGVAEAEGTRVIIEPPVFYPSADFHYGDGYYRTNDGHYYHYDKDRDGWHYGRNHREGMHYEEHHKR
jgi:hypothetical protein